MRIGLTGGGTGGHFFPLISVAEEIRMLEQTGEFGRVSIYYFGPEKYSQKHLKDLNIKFVHLDAGKRRLYSSVSNYFDIFKIAFGIFIGMFKLAIYYPDVIFSKGGYVAFPTLWVARLLRIPVVIHDSDSVPGRTTVWSAPFAKYICVSFREAGEYIFKAAKLKNPNLIMETGQPLRGVLNPKTTFTNEELIAKIENKDILNMHPSIPTILILGGSLGSQNINNAVLKSASVIIKNYQIIHQTGRENFTQVKKLSEELLKNTLEKDSYLAVPFLNEYELRYLYQNVSLIVGRSGSQLFEFEAFGIPSILVPIDHSNGDHQRKNAYTAMTRGTSFVMEEKNLSPHILENEINRLMKNHSEVAQMSANGRTKTKIDAAGSIAKLLLGIASEH